MHSLIDIAFSNNILYTFINYVAYYCSNGLVKLATNVSIEAAKLDVNAIKQISLGVWIKTLLYKKRGTVKSFVFHVAYSILLSKYNNSNDILLAAIRAMMETYNIRYVFSLATRLSKKSNFASKFFTHYKQRMRYIIKYH